MTMARSVLLSRDRRYPASRPQLGTRGNFLPQGGPIGLSVAEIPVRRFWPPRALVGTHVVPAGARRRWGDTHLPLTWNAMSKRTKKAKTRAHRKKANHGRKPNRGRG